MHNVNDDELMPIVPKQVRLKHKAASDDEAGVLGLPPHRGFERLRIKNYVVQSGDYDERRKRKV